jgi:hypothetical protein
MKCAAHSDTDTSLACGKCGTPICPRCLVQTPVGSRCRKCAGVSRIPTYKVTTSYYLKATGAGLGMSIVCGFIWRFIGGIIPFFYLNFLIASAVGYVISEVISLATNRKRGVGLMVIAGLAVVISYVISAAYFWSFTFSLFDLAAVFLGIIFSVSRLY